MTRPRAYHAIWIGVGLTIATVARTAAVMGLGFSVGAVGVPLGLPWLHLWWLERPPRDRAVDVFEGTVYGLVALCELWLFFYLPSALGSSEGFILVPVWGGSSLATIALVLGNEFSRPPR
jgi:hypothetical protein